MDTQKIERDFRVVNFGSVCVLYAHTEAAQQWIDENIAGEAQQWGPNGVVVEPRYVEPIVHGMQAEGLRG